MASKRVIAETTLPLVYFPSVPAAGANLTLATRGTTVAVDSSYGGYSAKPERQHGRATEAQAERLRQGTTYAARLYEKGWECEWGIPWAAAGIDPAKVKCLQFNIGVRKTENRAWVIWHGTGGCTFNVANAGVLVLAP